MFFDKNKVMEDFSFRSSGLSLLYFFQCGAEVFP
jgi:hypothetical protein